MQAFQVDPESLARGCQAAAGAARAALRWASVHSGLPAIVVASIGLVVGWRLVRLSARLALEIAVALAVLAVATTMGWIVW